MSEVSKSISNVSIGNLSVLRLSRELENEGVEISNEKLQILVDALKVVMHRVFKQAIGNQEAVMEALTVVLSERTALREKMVTAVVS